MPDGVAGQPTMAKGARAPGEKKRKKKNGQQNRSGGAGGERTEREDTRPEGGRPKWHSAAWLGASSRRRLAERTGKVGKEQQTIAATMLLARSEHQTQQIENICTAPSRLYSSVSLSALHTKAKFQNRKHRIGRTAIPAVEAAQTGTLLMRGQSVDRTRRLVAGRLKTILADSGETRLERNSTDLQQSTVAERARQKRPPSEDRLLSPLARCCVGSCPALSVDATCFLFLVTTFPDDQAWGGRHVLKSCRGYK